MKDILPGYRRGPDDNGLKSQPFSGLGKQLARRRKRALFAQKRKGLDAGHPDEPSPTAEMDEDQALFLKAMEGVTPLGGRREGAGGGGTPPPLSATGHGRGRRPGGEVKKEDVQVLEELKALCRGHKPITVRYTPEYVEGVRIELAGGLAKRLHAGAFAVQAYCDLHGMDSVAALEVCHRFVTEALRDGKKCVALIHGRGLSSRGEPVLKRLVVNWLRQGPYRKHVLAFASAPHWDGGAGVTYVLLRKRPARCRARRCKKEI